MTLKQIIGNRLYSLRYNYNMTQAEMAARVGIHTTAWNKYENAARMPSITVLFKIAECLDVSLDYIVGRTKYKVVEV